MAEKAASLRRIPPARRRQGRRVASGVGDLVAHVPRDPGHGLPLLRAKRHYRAPSGLIAGAGVMGAAGSFILGRLAADRMRPYGLRLAVPSTLPAVACGAHAPRSGR